MKRPNRIVQVVLFVALIVILTIMLKNKKPAVSCDVTDVTTPSGTSITAEIASSQESRATGLSNRDSLATNGGMLFLFDTPGVYGFWMKNTRIPLDLIWLQNKRVVAMQTLEPQTGETIPQYTPTQTADAVLEINKGIANQTGIGLGSELAWAACE